MSSTPTVKSSLTQRFTVHAMKTMDTIPAKAAEAANGPHPSMPRPVTTMGRLCRIAKAALGCTKRAYAGALTLAPSMRKIATSR